MHHLTLFCLQKQILHLPHRSHRHTAAADQYEEICDNLANSQAGTLNAELSNHAHHTIIQLASTMTHVASRAWQ